MLPRLGGPRHFKCYYPALEVQGVFKCSTVSDESLPSPASPGSSSEWATGYPKDDAWERPCPRDSQDPVRRLEASTAVRKDESSPQPF